MALAIGTVLLGAPASAFAGEPLGAPGTRIGTSNYAVDLFHGPVLAGSRVTALSGAYTAIGEGADGLAFNAASPAVRMPYSSTTNDWDLSLGVTFPASLRNTDFDNNGSRGFKYQNFLFGTIGAVVQHDRFGIGASVDLYQYDIGVPGGADSVGNVTLRLAEARLLASYSFLDDQLYVGGGLRGVLLALQGAGGSTTPSVGTTTGEVTAATSLATGSGLFSMLGVGGEVGGLYAPTELPFRAGLTLRSPVSGKASVGGKIAADADGNYMLGTTAYLPDRIVLPWEIDAGVAVQFGPRPINLRWMNTDTLSEREIAKEERNPQEPRKAVKKRIAKKRYDSYPRKRLLVSLGFRVTGAVDDAIGFESFLSQQVERSGRHHSFTPRIGAEGEPWEGRLVLRAGGYVEPTRFDDSTPRVHGTGGFDVRTFSWDVFGLLDEGSSFRVGAAADGARAYLGWSVTAGLWH